jgi:hypothetical protein
VTSSSGAELYEPGANGIAPAEGLAGPAAPPPAPTAGLLSVAAGGSSPPPPSAPAPAGGPALRRREVWAEVPGYEDYQIKLWLNYPRHLEEAIQGVGFRPMPPRPAEADAPGTPDEDAVGRRADALRRWTEDITAWQAEREASMRAALGRVVLEHNGWRDYDPPDGTGLVLPPPQDPGFWDAIPQELMNTLLALRQAKADELPNSLRPRRRS